MEVHERAPSTQHYNGEMSYIDKMEKYEIWYFSWFGYSFNKNGCHYTYAMSGEYSINKQGLVIIKQNWRRGRYDSYVDIC